MKDWQALTGELADRLAAKRSARGLGWRGEAIAELAQRVGKAAEFADEVFEQAAADAAEGRYTWTVLDRSEGVPWKVLTALNECQKPFHLWNVERAEMEYPFELRGEPQLCVGRAASDGGGGGMPARIEKATQALAKWISDRAFEELVEQGNRRSFKRLLREPLPFGKAASGGPAPAKTVSWNPLTGGPPPPGVRPPGSGGFSFGPPGLGMRLPGSGGFSFGPPPSPPAGLSPPPGDFTLGPPPEGRGEEPGEPGERIE